MGILAWIIFGALAGWIANGIAGDKRRMGCGMNVVIGIVGASIGGLVFSAIGGTGVTGFNLWSLFVAVVGAVILLSVINALQK
ncbi:GlsB/YeaQ/YmgE family stress response membrane protein [Isachenkonia alkalipeptolytica]|uniref:GlsB/YeaQ/YmgE family stress response membrane protein n=1 Tax=Isachenkonia alkalipeptolytica TaxID=2565777 RepID=A0AA43XKU5_9CLOT|nr:GlsB/YeaQ/YmgE family stress response membrane protein [Isachenkonia alkalipeptolytica]NBG88703.1 GlsB/YeaQ/YmgE family stress response membrane protein [Isachenkonia alkalipeptolytica]